MPKSGSSGSATADPAAPDVAAGDSAHERATRREWAGLLVLALPCLVVSMDANMLNLALPRLATDLRVSGGQLLWIVDSYVFLCAGSLLTMGMVGDRFGRRRLLLFGGAAFAAASVLAAFATNAATLIAARGILGVAGATLMPSTLALILTMFRDPSQRRQALGVWTASFALGGLIGPVVGGLVLSSLSWSAVFLVTVPPMLVLLVVGGLLLPESRDPAAARIDVVSAVTSLAAVLAVVYGLKGLASGEAGGLPFLAIAIGLGLGLLFVRRQRACSTPILDPALFRRASFVAPLAVNSLAFFVLYGTQYLAAQYMQLVLGLSPLAAGLWGIPGTVAYLIGAAVGPLATRRATARTVVTTGLLVAAAGFGLLTQLRTDGGVGLLVAGTIVFAVGLAPVYSLTTEMTVAAAPSHRAGTVSAVQETGTTVGGALGIALLGSVSLALYRTSVADADLSLPTGVSGDVQGTLASALAAARGLPAPLDTAVADAARAAFTQSFVVAETIGVTLLVVAAGAFGVLLKAAAERSPSQNPHAGDVQRNQASEPGRADWYRTGSTECPALTSDDR